MTDAIIYSAVSQVRLYTPLVSGRSPYLVARVPSQGERVLAEFTAKSGNFLNVVQRILKNLPPRDNEVTYQYGE